MNAVVVYHTKTGHTRRAGEDVAAGLEAAGVSVKLASAREMGEWDVGDAAIVVVGSPCHAGSCHIRGGLSGPIRKALRRLGASTLAGKVGGAFAVNCALGAALTVRSIEEALRRAGARVAAPGVALKAGVPFSLFTGPMASEADRERLRELGRALAAAASGGS